MTSNLSHHIAQKIPALATFTPSVSMLVIAGIIVALLFFFIGYVYAGYRAEKEMERRDERRRRELSKQEMMNILRNLGGQNE